MSSLNENQKLATNPEISAKVMANAGAGKTYVLTARVLRLLLSGVHPGKILCLTYTRAAAAEMAERISSRLEEWALADDDKLLANLTLLNGEKPDAKQMALAKKLFSSMLESAPPPRIQTIHSFCQEVLKRFPLESGIQPYFEVLDNITSNELVKETVLRLLGRVNTSIKVGEAIDYIAGLAGENKFNGIASEIIQQRNRVREIFEKSELDEIVSRLYRNHNLSPDTNAAELIEDFFRFSNSRRKAVEGLASAIASSKSKTAAADSAQLERALKAGEFYAYQDIFLTAEGQPRAKTVNKDVLTIYPQAEEIIAFEQNACVDLLAKIYLVENLKFTAHVIYLAHGLVQTYEDAKKSRAVLDYNDLIYYTKKLLTARSSAAWVLYKLDGGIDHILIDEAQDTSPEQWEIVQALLEEFLSGEGAAANNRTVFIVGDEKQSIYSFQGADREKFEKTTEEIRARSKTAGKEFFDIGLETSFRSVEAVLRLADETFKPEELRRAISSGKHAIKHLLHRKDEGGLVEIWPLVKAEEKQKLEEWQLPLNYITTKSADLLLAEQIAETIANWLSDKRKLVSQNRSIRPSDILILLRSRGELADMLIKKLKAKNIPVSGSDRLKLTEHIAVQDLVSLSQFLLLPDDSLSLAEALKSPLFGISEDDLFELSYNRGKSSLWDVVKAKGLYPELVTLLNRVDFVSVYELYSIILDQMGGRKKFIARLGMEVNDVLDEFLELAVNFERGHTNSLEHFIHWLGVSNMEIKRDMEQAKERMIDEVRIMTVHGSKGLEAPVVFLADAAKFPMSKRQLVWDEEIFYCYKTKEKLGANIRNAVDLAEAADYQEYLRLLYVAITRARDEIYVCGSVGDKKANLDKTWYSLIQNSLREFGSENAETGAVTYTTPHIAALKEHKEAPVKAPVSLPEFMLLKPAAEANMRAEIEMVEISGNISQISRGKKIHKTFELINNLPEDRRMAYLQDAFKDDDKARIGIEKVFSSPELAEIFGADSKAEVPIIGIIDGQVVSARIDRLVISGNEIKVIDFKTTDKPPSNPSKKQQNQLLTYKKLVSQKYPNHKVRAFILWSATAQLVEVA